MQKEFILILSLLTVLSLHAQNRGGDRGNQRGGNWGGGWQEQMKQFDKDGDGKLNDAERTEMRNAFRKQMEDRRKEFMKQHDKDGDGNLNDAERQAMIEKFRIFSGRIGLVLSTFGCSCTNTSGMHRSNRKWLSITRYVSFVVLYSKGGVQNACFQI